MKLFAQPYDPSKAGFEFETFEEFETRAKDIEYEIEVLDGEPIDVELARAVGLSQNNLEDFIDWVESWTDDEKIRVCIAADELGYSCNSDTTPGDFDIVIYEVGSLNELAKLFVDEGYFGEIPHPIVAYLDYDKIASDLVYGYTETTIAGNRMVYRAA